MGCYAVSGHAASPFWSRCLSRPCSQRTERPSPGRGACRTGLFFLNPGNRRCDRCKDPSTPARCPLPRRNVKFMPPHPRDDSRLSPVQVKSIAGVNPLAEAYGAPPCAPVINNAFAFSIEGPATNATAPTTESAQVPIQPRVATKTPASHPLHFRCIPLHSVAFPIIRSICCVRCICCICIMTMPETQGETASHSPA